MTAVREVFRVPVCAVCGHAEGDHASNGAGLSGSLRFGVCLRPGCDCREFQESTEETGLTV